MGSETNTKAITEQYCDELLGITEQQWIEEEENLLNDAWDATEYGQPRVGRPTIYDKPMGTISFKEDVTRIQLIDTRAKKLGLSRSDYMRFLVDRDLATTA